MEPAARLPYQQQAHDALRHGLASLKEDTQALHPVAAIQDSTRPLVGVQATRMQMLRDVYGIAFPAKLEIERQILDKFERLPGLQSSKLGLESLTGALDTFAFESFVGLPEDGEVAPPDLHSQMEQKLGMSSTKPLTRGLL